MGNWKMENGSLTTEFDEEEIAQGGDEEEVARE